MGDDFLAQYDADTTALEYAAMQTGAQTTNENTNNNSTGNKSVFQNSGSGFFGMVEQGMAALTKNPIKVNTAVKVDNTQMYMLIGAAVVAGLLFFNKK